jgi:Ca2+-binding RTX toxin-like protein
MKPRAVLWLALIVPLASPPTVSASAITVSDDRYVHTADGTANTISIVSTPALFPSAGSYTFTDTSDITSFPTANCRRISVKSVECEADDIEGIEVNAGTGNDTVSMTRIGGPVVPLALNGADGADRLTGSTANDRIDGGAGDDILNGSAGQDTMLGGANNDEVNGGDGSDTSLAGGEGNDSLSGGDGEDALLGEGGDDVIVGGVEDDSVNGGPGVDRIRYDETDRLARVVVDLSTTVGTDGSPNESEDAVQFERVTGSRFDDVIAGDAQANQLDGGAGADQLSSGSGNDVLNGGDGNDTLIAGPGADTLQGQAGEDTLDGGSDADLVDGGADRDVGEYSFRTLPVTITVGDGLANDGQAGEADQVRLVEVLLGGAGNDTLTMVENAAATFTGNGGDDILRGGALDDTLVGAAGADTIDGRGGIDTTTYSEPVRTEGVTVTLGASGSGSSFDGAGDTVLATENLVGTALADTLTGDAAANDLFGAGGDDTLVGGAGADVLRGGDGADTVSYADRGPGDPVTITVGGTGGGSVEGDAIGADVENAIGGAGNDAITGDDRANALIGGAGDDTIVGRGGVDVFSAGTGDDAVDAVDGLAELVDCGDGADSINVDPSDQLSGCEPPIVPPAIPDRDGDGFFDHQDCAPTDPLIRPGALEVPGNAVDENCDGLKPGFPVLNSAITIFTQSTRRGARVTELTVSSIARGTTVEIRCKDARGRKVCPKRVKRTFTAARRKVVFTSTFKRKRLPPGSVVEVRVTALNAIGKFRRMTVRRTDVRTLIKCLAAGSSKLIDCT